VVSSSGDGGRGGRMHLVAMVNAPTSQYAENWRHPLSRSDWLSADFYVDLARTLERGRFDMMFLPDALAVPEDHSGSIDTTLRTAGKGAIYLDPMVTLGAVASATRHIGLGATLSTTFVPPYAIARSMLTLQHLSQGRAAWNIVTSTSDAEARNFGLDRIPEKDLRYDHADSVVRTVRELWRSWGEDALVLDRTAEVFADPSGVRRVSDVAGLSRGPLTLPRSEAGEPVRMQAGSSARGLRFAGEHAELVFGIAHNSDGMRQQRAEIRDAARSAGRDPNSVRVLMATQPVVGATTADARAVHASMRELIDGRAALLKLGRLLHAEESELDPTGDAASMILAHRGSTGSEGFERMLMRAASEGKLTVGELAVEQAMSQLHYAPVGSAYDVAAELDDLYRSGAADGFIVMSALYPASLDAFVTGVVPELQRRGVFPRAYGLGGLRDNLGLSSRSEL
jgi:FMN-dependent oxidoreductase (nitrilotriacetate monooxygenase family)